MARLRSLTWAFLQFWLSKRRTEERRWAQGHGYPPRSFRRSHTRRKSIFGLTVSLPSSWLLVCRHIRTWRAPGHSSKKFSMILYLLSLTNGLSRSKTLSTTVWTKMGCAGGQSSNYWGTSFFKAPLSANRLGSMISGVGTSEAAADRETHRGN